MGPISGLISSNAGWIQGLAGALTHIVSFFNGNPIAKKYFLICGVTFVLKPTACEDISPANPFALPTKPMGLYRPRA